MVAFAATIREQTITLGPQVLIFNSLGMDGCIALFIQGFNNLCRDTGNQAVRRHDGALGYNCAGSNDGALADYCAI